MIGPNLDEASMVRVAVQLPGESDPFSCYFTESTPDEHSSGKYIRFFFLCDNMVFVRGKLENPKVKI